MTREKPPIAVTLERFRRRARLSQRRLAELSDVSAAAIARIEYGFDRKSGGPVKPEPDTLLGLARGLTATEDGPGDEATVLTVYRELLEASGYDALILAPASQKTPAEAAEDRSPAVTYADLVRRAQQATGNRKVAIGFARAITNWNSYSEAERKLLEAALEVLPDAPEGPEDISKTEV